MHTYTDADVQCVAGVTQLKSIGQVLFDTVVHRIQLVESDYFDLEFTDHESIPVSRCTFSVVNLFTNLFMNVQFIVIL